MLSEATGIVIVALPSEATVVVPLKIPPLTSDVVAPYKKYSIEVPAATLDVVRINVAAAPSLTVVFDEARLNV